MHHHSPSWFMLSSAATAHIGIDALVPAVLATGLALLMVTARWYSRIVCRPGHVGLEDYFVSIAMLFSICLTGLIGGQIELDSQHSDAGDRRKANLAIMLKIVFTQSLLYHLSSALIKASFLLQYLRLFSLVRPITYTCYLLLAFVIGAAAWGVFGVIFLCNPIPGYWDLRVSGTRGNAEDHFFSTSILGIFMDWAIWVLPIPVIGRLKLPRRQKMGLLAVFGLGGIVCIVSILRLVLVHHFAHIGEVTKSGTFALIWSTIELNVAIICASLLVMKPLFARFIPAIVSEEPISAREDARMFRGLTGLGFLLDTEAEETGEAGETGENRETEGKQEQHDDGRRDTAVAFNVPRVAAPGRIWDPRRGLRGVRRSW